MRLWNGSAVVGLLAVVVAACTGGGPGPQPSPTRTGTGTAGPTARPVALVDTRATPAGWAPVADGDGQISVPTSWLVESPGMNACGGGGGGMVFVNRPLRLPRDMACKAAENLVGIESFGRSAAPPSSNATVNGIPVLRSSTAAGDVERAIGLGVTVIARGPLARRVLATLTRSPLAVLLASGPMPAVPSNWRWTTFGHLRFATPRWPRSRTSWWGDCGFFPTDLITLSTAKAPFTVPCPAPPPDAGFQAGHLGVVIGAGPFALAATPRTSAPCLLRPTVRLCPVVSLEAGRGVFLAYPADRKTATVMEIGLAGTGEVGRTILDSVRAA